MKRREHHHMSLSLWATSMTAALLLLGCDKPAKVGTFVDGGDEVIEIRAVGSSYALDRWRLDRPLDTTPHISTPLRVESDGSMVSEDGSLDYKLIPTERGVTMFSGGSSTDFTSLDPSQAPTPPNEGASLETSLDEATQELLDKLAHGLRTRKCRGTPGHLDIPVDHLKHSVAALDSARVSGFESSQELTKIASIYNLSATVTIPAHASHDTKKECTKRDGGADSPCAEYKVVELELSTPELTLPIKARAAVTRDLTTSQAKRELVVDSLGELDVARIHSSFCQQHVLNASRSWVVETPWRERRANPSSRRAHKGGE